MKLFSGTLIKTVSGLTWNTNYDYSFLFYNKASVCSFIGLIIKLKI